MNFQTRLRFAALASVACLILLNQSSAFTDRSATAKAALAKLSSASTGSLAVKGVTVNTTRPEGGPLRDDRGGPDDFGYRWVDSNEDDGPDYNWVEINEIGQGLAMADDDNQGPFDIGFAFPFYDEEYEQFRICSNGFITFGDEFASWEHREHSFPEQSESVPMNVIAPLWMDLNAGGEERVFYWTDVDQTMLVVEWSEVPTFQWDWYDGFGPKTFQVILYPSGRIVFQYMDENAPLSQGVIGIQNEDGSIGLTVASNEEYLEPELAVRIQAAAGWVTGTVTDLEFGDPISGATISLSDGSLTQTDDNGIYLFEEIGAGSYTASAVALGFNYVASDTFEVADQETTAVDFALPHPEITVDTVGFDVTLDPGQSEEHQFNITNNGNGLLEFSSRFTLPMRRDDPGDVMFEWDVSELTGDQGLRGVTGDGENYYLAGSNNSDDPNYIYVFSRDGEYLGSFAQPVQNPSRTGIRGLTTDGQYLYGADGQIIVQFDADGNRQAEIQGPLRIIYNLAYDPESDHFFISELTGDIYEIDRDGNTVQRIRNTNNLRLHGLAWRPDDPDGYNLYVLHQPDEQPPALSKINTANNDVRDVMPLNFQESDEAVAFDLSSRFNPLVWLGLALMENGAQDRLVGFEVDLNSSWITVDPMSGTVEPGSSTPVTATFSADDMDEGSYELTLVIESNAAGDPVELALQMTVTGGADLDHFDFIPTGVVHQFTILGCALPEEPATVDDEIGVFTPGEMCVGGARWTGDQTIVNAYGDAPETPDADGFTVGDAPTFHIWDRDINQDYTVSWALDSGDATFTNGGNSLVSLAAAAAGKWDFTATTTRHLFRMTGFTFGEAEASEGDEFGVFTVGGLCVGAVPWLGGATPLIAFGDDSNTEPVDGFIAGDSLIFRAWERDMENDEQADFIRTAGDSVFTIGGNSEGTLRVNRLAIPANRNPELPGALSLSASPNPFNSRTLVKFGLPMGGEATVALLDLTGRRLAIIAAGRFHAGYNSVPLNAVGLASGTYLVRLESAGGSRTVKLLLLH